MLPEALRPLQALATNLWWTDQADAVDLWAFIDEERWHQCHHNPVALLHDVELGRWQELAEDDEFVRHAEELLARMEADLARPTWAAAEAPDLAGKTVAYLSMEFGLHESVRIYSGGLGVLAGDHLRSASDLGVPIVAVGLAYHQGYFRQVFDDGGQIEAYPKNRFERMPIRRCEIDTPDGPRPVEITLPIGAMTVRAQVWRLAVGRTPLYLLDSDLDGNPEPARELTRHLYGGDETTRIRQEILLGIGGILALRAMGIEPDLIHLNEGHCAFAPLVHIAETSQEAARNYCVFTTHTPVPAGHDRFGAALVRAELGPWCESVGMDVDDVIALGRVDPENDEETVCMTVIGIRLSCSTNGVAALHGEVSRDMWKELWPEKPVADVPIGHVTNGVHPIFWMAPAARALFDQELPGWRDRPWDPAVWEGVYGIEHSAMWLLRNHLRIRLLDEVERKTGRALDPAALTIGFARRFAPYKRGDLIFSDPERLWTLLNGEQPVNLLFAGKAHPRDDNGKRIVSTVLDWATHSEFRDRVVLLEDYDIHLGGLLTSGSDVWLNNPRRPREASGTSGQKVIYNGGLNCSVLDGWWPEGFDGENGWQIGEGKVWEDDDAHDAYDTAALYRVLEHEVLPLWSDRDALDIPRGWIDRMKRSIATCAPKFSSHRMVRDYVREVYAPALRR
ncbi:MAG: alpha-glucan family phosphorylase [Myxococcota bacterium]